MALSGNLGFVPLNEVLRLLARAGQKGAVEVRGEDIRGRIFVTRRGIGLATTATDIELRSHLVNSEFVDDGYLRNVESGVATLESAAERDSGLIDLLREMTVESLYQMTSKGVSFEVDENSESPYASPKAFDLEAILDDSRRREDEWAEVSEMLSDMAGVIRMRRDLGNRDEVTVSRDAWKLLSELGSGSSVGELAARLGTTDFWTAKVAAEMTGRELLTLGELRSETPVEQTDSAPEFAPVPTIQEEVEEESPQEAHVAPEIAEDPENLDPDQSWWVEPQDETDGAETQDSGGEVPDSEDGDEADPSKSGRLGVFALNREGEQPAVPAFEPERAFDEVEEDTEAFLEKVFSELEQPEPEAEPAEEEGHGLLRRRRLGSLLQESQAKED